MQVLNLKTERLFINPLKTDDTDFILELVNTEAWLKFIGDRKIKSKSDALAFIQKILMNEALTYWVVKLKSNEDRIGMITFIKREYLEYYDIGFAFLPKYWNKGFAYEATDIVLKFVIPEYDLSKVLAITVPENVSSIKLLNKLGLSFLKEIEIDNKSIQVFGGSYDKYKL